MAVSLESFPTQVFDNFPRKLRIMFQHTRSKIENEHACACPNKTIGSSAVHRRPFDAGRDLWFSFLIYVITRIVESMKLSDYREGRPKRAFLLTPSRHLGINKRRSMDAREGGIEHLRREEPESINSFVIDATSSVRKTMESRSRFSNWSITSNSHRWIAYPLNVRDFIIYLFLRKRIHLPISVDEEEIF